MSLRVVAVLLALALAASCTSIGSEDIDTDAIRASIVAATKPAQPTNIAVSLFVGSSATDFVRLTNGETLTAAVDGGEAKTLAETNLLGAFSYVGELGTVGAEAEIVVAYNRTGSFPSAPASSVTTTQGLALSAPAGGESKSRASDDIVVTWESDASADPVTVSWSGPCVKGGERDAGAAATTLTIEAGAIVEADDLQDNQRSCDVVIGVVRERSGTVDPAFDGGTFTHRAEDSRTVTSTP